MATSKTTNTTTSSSSSSSSSALTATTFKNFGNLIKLLPTGTVFAFQFLNPIFTNNGSCSTNNKVFTSILIAVCGISCVVSSFTDSYKGSDGVSHYGIATTKGIWPSTNSGSVDLTQYKMKFRDFVHAFLALIVFAVLALLDSNTISCFYPAFASKEKALLMALPPVIGAVSGSIFMGSSDSRNGIGSPSSSTDSSESSSTTDNV